MGKWEKMGFGVGVGGKGGCEIDEWLWAGRMKKMEREWQWEGMGS